MLVSPRSTARWYLSSNICNLHITVACPNARTALRAFFLSVPLLHSINTDSESSRFSAFLHFYQVRPSFPLFFGLLVHYFVNWSCEGC